jgi:hypothetical protein
MLNKLNPPSICAPLARVIHVSGQVGLAASNMAATEAIAARV